MICWTEVGIALSSKVLIPSLVSLTVTTPSILASSLSSCACLRVNASPSKILKVNPVGKSDNASPYSSIMSWISAAVPVTTNSILFKF